MEAGSLRCDLNISIAPLSSSNPEKDIHSCTSSEFTYTLPFGTGHRVEVKNLNSLKQIIMAAEYEAKRQATQRLQYNPTKRETRTWDTKRLETIKMRDKGDAVDYRFMPEPDLPPVILNAEVRPLYRNSFFIHT
jgi:aspartyl-tRNA(Asn)/glutamyl-tRNA(Gln) amidotransferase subunit B